MSNPSFKKQKQQKQTTKTNKTTTIKQCNEVSSQKA
jgi:hypothetical protein